MGQHGDDIWIRSVRRAIAQGRAFLLALATPC